MLRVIVDNTAGGDRTFASELARRLEDQGYEVEVRQPQPTTMFDTAIHLVTTGIVLRVPERPERETLAGIGQIVRATLATQPSLRRRSRSIPVQLGETARVLEWIDVFA